MRERQHMAKNMKAHRKPTHDEIAACAHRIYESEGRPEGKAMEHWLQAEAQLIAEFKAEADSQPVKAARDPLSGPGRQRTPEAPSHTAVTPPANLGVQRRSQQNLN
jgi:hypothetical protein